MTKCSVFILFVLLISGIIESADNYKLSKNQISRLREVGTQWKEIINWEKEPCDDMYDFVCSNKERPESKIETEVPIEITNQMPEEFVEAVEKYLTYCADFKEDEIYEFIKSFKFDFIGNWPAFEEKWNNSKFNLPLAIAEMSSYNMPVIFNDYFTYDTFETYLQINKEVLVNINDNKDLLKSTFESIGIKNPEEVLKDAALFENTFIEAVDSIKFATDIKIKFSELKNHFPEIDWDKQIEVIYEAKLSEDYPVMLKSHEELKSIYKSISKLDPKIIANYMFCSFVYDTMHNSIHFLQKNHHFIPILKGAIIQYNENIKEIFKGMSITVIETLQQVYKNLKTENIAEEIISFINEDIFRYVTEEDLIMELQEISTNKNDCMKTFNQLQKLSHKHYAKLFFNNRNALIYQIKMNIIDSLYDVGKIIDDPSPFIFKPIITSILPNVIDHFENTINFTNAANECATKQFTNETTEMDMKFMFIYQLMFKTFLKWIEANPNVVQEENKILQEYGFTTEKLLIISFGKHSCTNIKYFDVMMTAAANLEEFSNIYDCPVGSKLHQENKCELFTLESDKTIYVVLFVLLLLVL